MVRRLGLGKNNHLTYASLALNPRNLDSVGMLAVETLIRHHILHIVFIEN